jgi:hypothetical protein
MGKTTLLFLAILLSIPSARSQDLDPADVRISLDQALPIAITKAKTDFSDLEKYILYSVHPRVLKGDAEGLFWEVLWEEKAFPHYKQLRVRVYMSNGSTKCFRTEKGTFQKKHDKCSADRQSFHNRESQTRCVPRLAKGSAVTSC